MNAATNLWPILTNVINDYFAQAFVVVDVHCGRVVVKREVSGAAFEPSRDSNNDDNHDVEQ